MLLSIIKSVIDRQLLISIILNHISTKVEIVMKKTISMLCKYD